MLDITAEESVFAEQVAREDFIKSQAVRIITEEEISNINNEFVEIPICMDFDRFTKVLR